MKIVNEADCDQQPLPFIHLSGNAKNRGEQYGRKAKSRILLSLENYKCAYEAKGISWSMACSFAAGYIKQLRVNEEDLLIELQATADTVGVNIDELLAINCRTEVLYGLSQVVNEKTDGCTGAVVLPKASHNGRLLHFQNWDWRDNCANTSVILKIEADDGSQIITQTEAGILARCGFNDAGVSMTGNFLKTQNESLTAGVPIPFIRRRILEQRSYADAVGVALKYKKTFSVNLMLAHSDGECIDLETCQEESFWVQAEDNGLLVHANHFISTPARCKYIDEGLMVAPCSLHRYRRVRDSLMACLPTISMDDIKRSFGDKFSTPSSVCAEPNDGPGGDNSATVLSILMDPAAQTMWVAVRPYMGQDYTEYSFTKSEVL